MEHHDVVIVGAGVWGLCAAHTFLSINPSISLIIVDCKQSIGGVWASEQLYPGLRTNSLQGYYEYTDFPMTEAGVGIKPRGYIQGKALHAYLAKYAEHFDLTRRLRLQTRVLRAAHNDNDNSKIGWTLELASSLDRQNEEPSSMISCGKLVVATGQASAPFMPDISGLSSFANPTFHTVDLGRRAPPLLNNDDVKIVTVVGASKSAHDAVYLFATAGKQVNWIIHPASMGRGAVPMSKSFVPIGIWKNVWIEALLMVRPFSWVGIAPWSKGDGFGWIRTFLHSTNLGRYIVKTYFDSTGMASAKTSGILDDEKAKALFPGDSMMWYGTQGNALTYDTDFYQLVCGDKVTIVPGDIVHIDRGHVRMQDSTSLKTDALVFATGYDYTATVPLEPASMRLGWGCPVDSDEDAIFSELDPQSDKQLFAQFPILQESPSKPERRPARTPWRLWRFLAPPSQASLDASRRDLVFLNAITSYQTMLKCEITSLWAYAYLHDRLAVATPNDQEVKKEISLWTRFGKWRNPYGMQGKMADFMYDAVPYYDLLLRDLGLKSWRKGWSWLGEVFGGPLKTEDYKGIVQEWVAAQGLTTAEDQKKSQ